MNVIGKYCVIRGNRSGVFAGVVEEVDGQQVTLRGCRRIWYWAGAASLSQLAMEGVKKPAECRFTMSVNEIVILDAIEVIPTTAKAEANIKAVSEWKM